MRREPYEVGLTCAQSEAPQFDAAERLAWGQRRPVVNLPPLRACGMFAQTRTRLPPPELPAASRVEEIRGVTKVGLAPGRGT